MPASANSTRSSGHRVCRASRGPPLGLGRSVSEPVERLHQLLGADHARLRGDRLAVAQHHQRRDRPDPVRARRPPARRRRRPSRSGTAGRSWAARSNCGAIARHGPHQPAQKSITVIPGRLDGRLEASPRSDARSCPSHRSPLLQSLTLHNVKWCNVGAVARTPALCQLHNCLVVISLVCMRPAPGSRTRFPSR